MIAAAGFSKRAIRLGRGPALAAIVLAPAVLYLIARTAAAGSGSPAVAAAVASMPPADYRGLIKAVARAAQSPLFRPDVDMMALSRKAAAAAPTSYEPFFVAALAEDRAGRLGHAIQLMEESRRRRPGHAATRLELIVYYGKARRFDPLLEELDMALALNQEARRLILPELTKLIADPEGRAALARMLARNPAWRKEFHDAARGRKVRPEYALLLMKEVAALTGGRAGPERGLYLQSLLEAGQFVRARTIWSAGLAPAERAKDGLLFDGAFNGSGAPPPFNWQFHDGDVGRAEPAREPGRRHLDIVYYGGRDFTLAEQTLALAPGRYRLSFRVRSEAGIKSGDLSWRVTCTALANPAVTLSLAGATAKPASRSAGFVVPQACGSQRLLLVAQPGDLSAEVRAEISAMEIARDG